MGIVVNSRGCAIIVVLLLAAVSTATAKYSGGTGEPNDPYQIATAEDLIELGETPADYDKHFILTADIDLDPNLPGRKVFDKAVIAPDTDPCDTYSWSQEIRFTGPSFAGVFDGSGHAISHLTIAGEGYLGLFGQLEWPAEVKNLGAVDVNILGSGNYVGALAGRGGTVTSCYSTGVVSGADYVGGLVGFGSRVTHSHSAGAVSGGTYVGGLVGFNNQEVNQCHSTAVVSGEYDVGGLVGWNDEAYVTECYSTGMVSGIECVGGLVGDNIWSGVTRCYSTSMVSGQSSVGGLVGENIGTIADCYSEGSVTGDSGVGGLVGRNGADWSGDMSPFSGGGISNCYSVSAVTGTAFVGGLLGENVRGEVTDCFWDIQTSGQTKSAAGAGKITAEMQEASTFFDWGVCEGAGVWAIDDRHDYPRLSWEHRPGQLIRPSLSDFLEGHGTQDDPYLIYTLADVNMTARFPCEKGKHFRLMFVAGEGTQEKPYLIYTIDEIGLLNACPYEQDAYYRLMFVQGEGTQDRPYLISAAEQLTMVGMVQGREWDKHFTLVDDIDLDPGLPGGKVFNQAVIAPATFTQDGFGTHISGSPFMGVFDGNGHTISHLTVTGENYLGLFGYLSSGAQVRDLGVLDVNIAGSGNYVGGLVGSNGTWEEEGASIADCRSSGTVSGSGWVGGLVGSSWGNVTQCYSTAEVTGNRYVGGLVGYNAKGAVIAQSYSSGTAIGTGGSNLYYDTVGGLVGENHGAVTQCYSSGVVSGTWDIGGLVGSNHGTIAHCYSMGAVAGESGVGGLVGANHGTVSQCYSTGAVSSGSEYICGLSWGSVFNSVWDMDTSGSTRSLGGVGLTTVQMMDPYMLGLNGFANDPNWVLDAGRDYPRLAWEGTPGEIIPEPAIDWFEGQGTSDSPYRIVTADQLILLGRASVLCDRHFVLGADLNLDPALPGGQVFENAIIPAFTGVFDGGGHTISHLTLEGGNGLFGHLASGAELKDLGVVDVNISSDDSAGGLVCWNAGTVTDCYSTGMVSGRGCVGGLVGQNYEYDKPRPTVTRCYSTAMVAGDREIGGLVGANYYGTVTQCYSTGSVSGTGWSVGGLVGRNQNRDALVMDCYSTGAVTGGERVGGLVGWNFEGGVGTCYSTGTVSGRERVGGLIGVNDYGSAYTCFWDVETSGQATSADGRGKTTADMHTANTFLAAYWDFVGETKNGKKDIWWIDEGKDYPRLWWETGDGASP